MQVLEKIVLCVFALSFKKLCILRTSPWETHPFYGAAFLKSYNIALRAELLHINIDTSKRCKPFNKTVTTLETECKRQKSKSMNQFPIHFFVYSS